VPELEPESALASGLGSGPELEPELVRASALASEGECQMCYPRLAPKSHQTDLRPVLVPHLDLE
jgi:hypothetical protein